MAAFKIMPKNSLIQNDVLVVGAKNLQTTFAFKYMVCVLVWPLVIAVDHVSGYWQRWKHSQFLMEMFLCNRNRLESFVMHPREFMDEIFGF